MDRYLWWRENCIMVISVQAAWDQGVSITDKMPVTEKCVYIVYSHVPQKVHVDTQHKPEGEPLGADYVNSVAAC